MDFFYLVASHRQPYQSIFKPGCAAAVVLVSALDVLPVLINTDQLLIPIFLRPISIVWHSERAALPPQPDRRTGAGAGAPGCLRPAPCPGVQLAPSPMPWLQAPRQSCVMCQEEPGDREMGNRARGGGHHGEQLKERGRARRAGGVPCEV